MTAAPRHYAPRGDRVDTTLLGYRLEITNRDVTVRDKHGRKLVTVASMSAARLFIKGYRRDDIHAVKAELAASPAKATASSDKETLHAA